MFLNFMLLDLKFFDFVFLSGCELSCGWRAASVLCQRCIHNCCKSLEIHSMYISTGTAGEYFILWNVLDFIKLVNFFCCYISLTRSCRTERCFLWKSCFSWREFIGRDVLQPALTHRWLQHQMQCLERHSVLGRYPKELSKYSRLALF